VQKLHLALLGTFHLTTTSGATIQLTTEKARGLLAYLAVEADRPHRREALAGLFWPEMDDKQAKYNLRRTLHRLRQSVDEVDPDISETLITAERYVLQLHAAGLARDHAMFQEALSAYETHDHPEPNFCPECSEKLETAASLYQGEFLAGFSLGEGVAFEEWLLVQREFLHQKALQILHILTNMKESQGDTGAALKYVQRQIALDPYYEPAYRQGMRIQALNGMRSQALALYNQCHELLADELGVEPEPETSNLWQQIKDNTLTAAPLRPTRTEIHNFPTPQTPFIGRQQEIDQIITKLADPDCRVLSLLGPGGMGKTRLSLEVGRQLGSGLRLYRDGVFFISLLNVTNRDQMAATIAQRLGLRLEEQTTPRSQLLAYLRNKEMLLVFDNFEQIREGATLVAEIVSAAPKVEILVTSREPLNIQAEWRQMIRGLDLTGEGSEAIELFQRSARRMVPSFNLHNDDKTAVIELSRLVDGMPLALEIAATWVRVMNPADILAQTKRNLDFLASPFQDLPERHQSVRAVLAQTWQQLSSRLQDTLSRVALFPAEFSLEAAQSILPELTMLDVATLLDRSLLHGLPQERYEMHSLLRQFGSSQSHSREQRFQETYSAYYLNLVAQQEEQLNGRKPEAAMTIIQTELAHVRQAWEWAVELRQVDGLQSAVSALTRFYHLAGLFQEAQQRFQETIKTVQNWPVGSENACLLVELHAAASLFLGQIGQVEAAVGHSQSMRRLAEELKEVNWVARSHRLEGEWYRYQGRFAEAEEHLEKALQLYTLPLPNRQVAHAHNEIGFIHLNQSRYSAALDAFTQAREMYEAIGEQTETSTTLGNIGYIYQLKAQFPQALEHLQQALDIAETIGYKQGIVKHNLGLGSVYLDLGEIETSRSALEKALQVAQGLGYLRGIITSLIQIGSTYFSEGKLPEADTWFQQARTQAEAVGLRDLIAQAIGKQATVRAVLGDNQAAITHYQQTIQWWQELNNQTELGRNLSHLGNIYFRLGDSEQAVQYFESGLTVAQATGAQQVIASTMFALGNAYKAMGKYDRGLSYYQQSLDLSQKLGLRSNISNCVGSIGLIYYEQGNFEEARKAYEQALKLSDEMGKASLVGLWWLNIGQAEIAMEQYEMALQNTQKALARSEELGNQRHKAMGLIQQAQILLEQGQLESAELSLTEALQISEPIKEKILLFESHLLQARLWYALGEQDKAKIQLDKMLGQYDGPPDQARLHYHLWQLTGDEGSRETAVTLYQQLLTQTPSYQYRRHLNELLSA
jgi:tetratricopeptide (TPR) repeat protein